MRVTHLIVLLLASMSAWAVTGWVGADDRKPETADFLNAVKSAQLRRGEPVIVKAHFLMHAFKGKPVGTYELEWLDAGNWREVIDAPGYHQERGMSGGNPWRKRPYDYTPAPFYEVQDAFELNEIGWITVGPQPTAKIRNSKIEKERVWCGEFRGNEASYSEICIDTNGNLKKAAGWVLSGWRAWGNRSFPSEMVHSDPQPDITLTINEIHRANATDPARYLPIPGSSPFPACGSPDFVWPVVVKKIPPSYPGAARTAHIEGTVVGDVTLDSAGNVASYKAVESSNPDLARSAEAAVRQWKYHPAVCAGKPMPTELEVTIHYTLSP